MAVTEYLVRDCTPQVNQGSVDVPDWLDIRAHLVDWSGSGTVNNADTTTFEDEGWTSQMAASRGITWELNGKSQEDPDNGDRDPGQLYIEAWARSIGSDSRKEFRILTPAGTVLAQFQATANMATPAGGGSDDASNWGVALTSSGPVTSDDLPVLPGAPTSPDATAGNDSILGTWTASATGAPFHRYEVATFTDVGDVLEDTRQVAATAPAPTAILVDGLTNTTAYYFKVRAQNAAGWGPWSADSDTVTTT